MAWLDTLGQDFHFALRRLRKSPAFSIAAVLVLALGIGPNSAAFSLVNAVTLRPLPYRNSDRLVSVNSNTKMFPDMSLNLTWPAFERVRKQVSSLEQSAVCWAQAKVLTEKGESQLLQVAGVSGEFFEQLGVPPRLGRFLAGSDGERANENVILLSDVLWRTRFGADPKIVGRTLTLDRKGYTVVGVGPKGFEFPKGTDAWIPLVVEAATKKNPTFFAFSFVGRLKPGVPMNRLNAELRIVSAQMEREFTKLNDGYALIAMKLLDSEIGDWTSRASFYALLGAATLLVLIACTNLASMLLARGFLREREMAVRAALGASSGRILRQVLVETSLLGALGGGTGAGLAALGVNVFRAVAPEDTPRLTEIHPDWPMVIFALVSALLTGMLFGLAPAWQATRVAFNEALKRGFGATGTGMDAFQSKAGRVLVIAEIALAFVLLSGAGLMLQTLRHVLAQGTGFSTENLLTLDLNRPLSESEADREEDATDRVEQTRSILEQIQSLSAVRNVAAANYGLLDGNVLVHGGLKVEGSATVDPNQGFAVTGRYVSPTYFKTLGLALLRGREFNEQDTLYSSPVAIVNERMARKYWGNLEVLGKRFTSSKSAKGEDVWAEVVGVVTDAREFHVRDDPVPEYFLSLYQQDSKALNLLVRTTGDADAEAGTIAKRIWSAYPGLAVTHLMTIRRTIEKSVGSERLHSALLGGFAGIGLMMSLAGTYGVIAYAVERRVREIGIRIALGARRKDVLLLVGTHAFVPVLIGIAIGVPAALFAQRVIAGELYGVKVTDPFTFATVALLMASVAAVGSYGPARRAMRVDPIVALRHE